jgi:hypothetical protein
MKRIIYFLLVTLCFWQCSSEGVFPEYQQKLVVDGWIENGNVPQVFLTFTSPYFTDIDSLSALSLLASYGKVSVSSVSDSEILTFMPANFLFPPYLYSGISFTGKIGNSYKMEAVVSGKTYTAQTTIPLPPVIDSVWIQQLNNSDTLGIIRVSLNDPTGQSNYYRIYTQIKGTDKTYTPARLPNYSDESFNGKHVSIPVYRGRSNNLTSRDTIYFDLRDTIRVKVCSMNKETFDYWNAVQQQIDNSSNPMVSQGAQLPTNITGGAIGYWCGYGITEKYIYPVKTKRR